LKAVKNGDIVIVDPDTSSRWGPRIADFVKAIAAAVQQVVSHA
jgi:iron complex transport system substrate-binding protein